MDTHPLRVGVVRWQKQDGLAKQHIRKLEQLGHEAILFAHDALLPPDLDLVFAYGPLGSLVPIANQLLALPRTGRPSFALLLTEQLPDPRLPEWFRYAAGKWRAWVERQSFQQQADGAWRPSPRWHWLTGRGQRFRYYGDLYWLQRQGLLSVLAVWSSWTAAYLRGRGFPAIALSPGCNPDWGYDMRLERDIPVLWIGKVGSERRGQLLQRVRADLHARGVEVMVVDGVEHPYVFGEARTILLNRTKIALNLLREKWDDNSMRYILAAHNGALVVTEPTLPHTPFRPGVHVVESPIETMAETICHYLADEAARQQVVNQAYQLIQSKPALETGIAEILQHLFATRPEPQPPLPHP